MRIDGGRGPLGLEELGVERVQEMQVDPERLLV